MHRQRGEGRLSGACGAEAVAGAPLVKETVIARAPAPNIISIAALSAASFTGPNSAFSR